MENFWLRHKTGMKQRPGNVFMVGLPLLTEELDEVHRKAQENICPDDKPEELYGAWI